MQTGCTLRTINRLIAKYEVSSKYAFVHKNRGRKPSIALSDKTKNDILFLFENKYYDANFKHALELMKTHDNINISYCTFYNILTSNGYISPKCNRSTRNNKATIIKNKQDNNIKLNKIEEDLIVCNNILDSEDFLQKCLDLNILVKSFKWMPLNSYGSEIKKQPFIGLLMTVLVKFIDILIIKEH